MKKQNGFTLIELLVVIFIISILTGIGLVSFSGAQKQARDTTRRSDLGQYRVAIENYAVNNNGIYPVKDSGGGSLKTMCTSETLVGFMGQCLEDIKNTADASYTYRYFSDSANSRWVIYAKLETSGTFQYYCSNGKNGISASGNTPDICI